MDSKVSRHSVGMINYLPFYKIFSDLSNKPSLVPHTAKRSTSFEDGAKQREKKVCGKYSC